MRVPRLLPLVAVSIGGVLAINAVSSAAGLPSLFTSARAFAEETSRKASKPAKAKSDVKGEAEPISFASKADAANKLAEAAQRLAEAAAKLAVNGPLPERTPAGLPAAAAGPNACAPTDLAIAKEAGLSPEQMRLLENLQARRGQLDDREKAMEMQLQLLAAAETKLDAKIAALNTLKGDISTLLGQADEKQKAEAARMVGVYTTMAQSKPKEAAKQLTIMDDAVRLPIAAGLSNRTLATILANMAPADAKKLNEALAHRLDAQKLDAQRQLMATPPAAPVAAQVTDKPTDKAAPVKTAALKPKKKPAPAAKKPSAADGAAPMQTAPVGDKAPSAPAAPAAPAAAEKAATG